MDDDEFVEITFDSIESERETEKAILALIECKGYWLPKSQIAIVSSQEDENGEEVDIVIMIPNWLAVDKELV